MEIQDESYSVVLDDTVNTVLFKGSLRLSGMTEYTPIVDLLNSVVAKEPAMITLNLQELEFLNSSGISMLSKFVIGIRNKKNIKLVIVGAEAIPWQGKSLKNLQRLMPDLSLELI